MTSLRFDLNSSVQVPYVPAPAFENPDIISGANLESILKMIEKGDYTNIPKLFGQPSDTRRVLKAEADRLAQQNK